MIEAGENPPISCLVERFMAQSHGSFVQGGHVRARQGDPEVQIPLGSARRGAHALGPANLSSPIVCPSEGDMARGSFHVVSIVSMGLILEYWDGRMCRSPREDSVVASGLHSELDSRTDRVIGPVGRWRDVDSAGNGDMWRSWGGVDWWVIPMFVQGLF